MSRAKELLEAATPLPWHESGATLDAVKGHIHSLWGRSEWRVGEIQDDDDSALIVYAVNRLPDYEAAVETLERLVLAVEGHADVEPTETDGGQMSAARAALARLREKVPA